MRRWSKGAAVDVACHHHHCAMDKRAKWMAFFIQKVHSLKSPPQKNNQFFFSQAYIIIERENILLLNKVKPYLFEMNFSPNLVPPPLCIFSLSQKNGARQKGSLFSTFLWLVYALEKCSFFWPLLFERVGLHNSWPRSRRQNGLWTHCFDDVTSRDFKTQREGSPQIVGRRI